jgi:hypothetical protein
MIEWQSGGGAHEPPRRQEPAKCGGLSPSPGDFPVDTKMFIVDKKQNQSTIAILR